jgi:hypothetical protein
VVGIKEGENFFLIFILSLPSWTLGTSVDCLFDDDLSLSTMDDKVFENRCCLFGIH